MDRMVLHFLLVFIVHLLHAELARTADDWRFGTHPSRFLEPPPISRTHRLQSVPYHHPNHQHVNARFSWIPDSKPPLPAASKPWPPFVDTISKSVDYSYDLHCNPCNSVPWIPIITFARPKAIPQPQPPQHVTPLTSYYQTLNEMTANLLKPAPAIPQTIPFYIGPPVYQQHVHNSLWQVPSSIVEHAPPVSPISTNNIDPLHAHDAPHPVKNNVENINLSGWVQETKPVPLFHYTHSVDYPAQFEQTAALDFPVQPTPLPPPQPPHTAPSGAGNVDQGDVLHDVSNHLDDSKYSSSENKFTVTNNETAKNSKQLVDNSSTTNFSIDLTDYLTPPSDVSRDEWQHGNGSEADIKPLEDWAFIKEMQAKPEKRKKQIQIVVPYTVNKSKYNAKHLKENITNNWNLILKSNDPRSTTTLPIVRFLRDNGAAAKKQTLTDWQKLRKAIDSWTVERFSNHKYNSSGQVDVTTGMPPPVKDAAESLLRRGMPFRDKPKEMPDGIENRVSSGQKSDSVDETRANTWKTLPETAATTTKEKVYIVTPVPLSSYNFSSNYLGDDSWGLG